MRSNLEILNETVAGSPTSAAYALERLGKPPRQVQAAKKRNKEYKR